MKPLRTASRLLADCSKGNGLKTTCAGQACAWKRWTITNQPTSAFSSLRSSCLEIPLDSVQSISEGSDKDELESKNGTKIGFTKRESDSNPARLLGTIDNSSALQPKRSSSTVVPLIRRVVATDEAESDLSDRFQEQRMNASWAQRVLAYLDADSTSEDEDSQNTDDNFHEDNVAWTLRKRAHDDPLLREKYEASQNISTVEFDLDGRWAMRLQSQLDPSNTFSSERVQRRRLSTREERRDFLELSSGIQETLDFAEIIKREPWTDKELKSTRSRDDKAAEESVFDALEEATTQLSSAKMTDTPRTDLIDGSRADDVSRSATWFSFTTGRPYSITSILSGFIDLTVRKPVLTTGQYDRLLLELFNDEALAWLEANGEYTVEEIIAFAWILLAESTYISVTRLLIWTNRPQSEKRVPRVILHLLLKRRWLEPAVLQLLATHLNHRIANTIDPRWAAAYERFLKGNITDAMSRKVQPIENERGRYRVLQLWRKAVCILILIKHAAVVVPTLLPNLVLMLCKHVHVPGVSENGLEGRLNHHVHASLNKVFNKAIKLAARQPTDPFLNVAYQERAQFILIRHMSTFRPPLTLSLEGYRAVISVQLRHRKTVKERLWTELKSKAWPPYREDKLGIDALKKQEDYGVSRAQRAIINMREAGYGATEWEDSASILSGWDVNWSPTIQSRRLFLDRAISRNSKQLSLPRSSIWQSRILSTRTIEEAWAMFLNYVDEDTTKQPSVFRAMFEKIIFERKRVTSLGKQQNQPAPTVLAGDALETVASSRNPREQTYVPIPPPGFEAFLERYYTYFPVLDAETLRFLLPHASNLDQAYDFIKKSDLTALQKNILLRNTVMNDGEIPIVSRVLSSYIQMLSHFAGTPLPNHGTVSALSHALHLVLVWNPQARSPWRSLLQAVERQTHAHSTKTFWRQQWQIALDILHKMQRRNVYQDSAIFYTVCSIFMNLVRCASQVSPRGQYQQRHGPSPGSDAELRIYTGKVVKRMFKRMVTVDLRAVFSHTEDEMPFLPQERDDSLSDSTDSIQFNVANLLPHILYTPSPATLHMFVRLLAMLGDRKAIFELVRWMSIYHEELAAKATELASGSRQFRFVLLAVRVAIESRSIPFVVSQPKLDLNGADLPYAAETKQLVERVKNWNGWPSDSEVEDYMKNWLHNSAKEDEQTEPAHICS